MKNGSKEDYLFLDKLEKEYVGETADRILNFLSGFSLRKNDPRMADNIGAVAIIIKVLATFVFWIETTKAILVTEKVKT